jgi:DNA-binding FadR family transcriptional regulator
VIDILPGGVVRVSPLDTAPATEAMSLLVRRTADATFTRIHEIRLMLEPHVARVAAERAHADDIRELNVLLDRMAAVVAAHQSRAASHRDFDSAQRPDVELHRAIAKAAENELYVVLWDAIVPTIFVVRAAIFAAFEGPFPFLNEYREIVGAIERRQPVAAHDAMERHLHHVHAVWDEHLARERARRNDGHEMSLIDSPGDRRAP